MNKFQMDGKSVKWAAGGAIGLTEPANRGKATQKSIHPHGRSDDYRKAQKRRRASRSL